MASSSRTKRTRQSSERGESSNPPPPPRPNQSNTRFISNAHRSRFAELQDNFIVKERGFERSNHLNPHIVRMVEDRGWGMFTSPRTPFYSELVLEFYANGWKSPEEEKEPKSTIVRGRQIFFTARTINRIFGLSDDIRDNELKEAFRSKYQIGDGLIERLCVPGSVWEYDRFGNPANFRSSALRPIPKAWYVFLRHSLIPTSNKTEVTLERAIYLDLIMRGRPLNIGGIISHQLEKMVNKGGKAALGFPWVISELCKREPINLSSLHVEDSFPDITVKQINSWVGQFPDDYLLEAPPPPPPQQAPHQGPPPPFYQAPPHPTRARDDAINRRFDALELSIDRLSSSITDRTDRLACMFEQMSRGEPVDPWPFYPTGASDDVYQDIDFDAAVGPSGEADEPDVPPEYYFFFLLCNELYINELYVMKRTLYTILHFSIVYGCVFRLKLGKFILWVNLIFKLIF